MTAANGVAMPPYCAITPLVQYTVPAKYTIPLARPRLHARSGPGRAVASATSSGASAIQPNSG
jgi:hypothetical protein